MSMLNRFLRPPASQLTVVSALAVTLALAACGASGTQEAALTTQAPIALTPKQDAGAPGALAGKLNEAELRKAVERYNLAKQREPGPMISLP